MSISSCSSFHVSIKKNDEQQKMTKYSKLILKKEEKAFCHVKNLGHGATSCSKIRTTERLISHTT
jgi:predicted alpha/beta superfamily hydrolase